MARPLHLQVLTPTETLLDAEDVHRVHLRLVDGVGISIYPGHAPLLAETVTAPLRYADADGEHALHAEAGILQVDDGEVMIFTTGRPGGDEVTAPPAVTGERRFERLARELQERLENEPRQLFEADER